MKRDIRVNYGILKGIVNDVDTYKSALDTIQNAIIKIEQSIQQSSGEAIEMLVEKSEGFQSKIKSCKEELKDISEIFSNYIYSMTDIIYPIDENSMMQVDRNDIYWNMQDIIGACLRVCFATINVSAHGAWAGFGFCESDEEIAREERNYNKLNSAKNILNSSSHNWNNLIDDLNKVYKKIQDYENMDDSFKKKASKFKSKYTNFWEGIGDFFENIGNAYFSYYEGIKDSLWELIKGLHDFVWGTVKFIGAAFVLDYCLLTDNQPPKWADDCYWNTVNGIENILKDPYLIVEGLAQGISDSIDEKGIAYGTGYAAGTIVSSILLDKGLKNVLGGAGKVAGSFDDILKAGANCADDLIKLGVNSLDDLIKLGICSADDLARIGLTSLDELAKIGISSIDDIVKLGVSSIDDLAKIGVNTVDDIAMLGASCIDDLAKLGINSIDDLAKIGVSCADDLVKLGINTIDDLARLGVNSVDDLAKLGIKSTDDLAKVGINSVDDMEKLGIKLSNNQKGNFGEMKMDDLFESQGYERISTDRVADLNSPTHQGIDGVYYNPGPPPEYIIGEAKFGSSTLSTLKDGTKQMSDKWIKKRLREAMSPEDYKKYLSDKKIYPDCEKHILVNVASDGTIKKSLLDATGKIIK